MRKEVSTGTPSEVRVGYSRAVVIDNNRIYFSGTTSQDSAGNIVGNDVYSQAKNIFSIITNVLVSEGFTLEDTVLVRAYLTDMKQLVGFDSAFSEHFAPHKPACTLVGVSQLVDPHLLIEIECIGEKASR